VIDLSKPALHAEGVAIFSDHADPALFHYVPDRPALRLDADGRPELSLLKYQLDPTLHEALGAGLLSLTVGLAVDEERLDRLRRRLAAHTGVSGVTLGPIGAERGTCELILIDRASRDEGQPTPDEPEVGFGLVERIIGAAAPSLYGTNDAVFAAVLSAEGASLVERALRQHGLPAGIVYTLDVTALRPALRASITARWQDVYHFYENRLHGGKLLLATDIGATVEQLVHDEAISISVDNLVPEAEQNGVYQRALDQAQQYVLRELFKPSLGQAPPPADDASGAMATIGRAIKDFAGFFSLTYSLREVDRSELKTFTYQLSAAQAETLTLSPQGTLAALVGPEDETADLDGLITVVAAGPPGEMRFDVGALIELAQEDIDHLEVLFRYGDTQRTLVLDSSTPRQQLSVWFDEHVGLELAYEYEVHFGAGGVGLADVLASPRVSTANRVIRLDPRELYQRVTLEAVLQGVPTDRYPRVLVDLRAREPVAGWSATETLELDAAHPSRRYAVRVGLDGRLQIERRLRYIDAQGLELSGEWEDTEPGFLIVGDPMPNIVDVQVLASARFETLVKRLIVELRPRAHAERLSTFILTAAQPNATWSWRVEPGGDRTYEYRVTLQSMLNEVREGQWLPGPSGGTLVVGEGIARMRKIQLMLVGRSLQELGLFALKVRFSFQDREAGLLAEDEFLVDDIRKPVSWTYPVADSARQAYTCQLTYIGQDGTIQDQPAVSSSDLLLVMRLA
jgi:hypothetical protein